MPIRLTSFGPKSLMRYMARRDNIPPERLYKKTENPVNRAVSSNFRIIKMMTSDFFSVKIAIKTTRLLNPSLAPGANANGDGNKVSTIPIMVAVAVSKAI